MHSFKKLTTINFDISELHNYFEIISVVQPGGELAKQLVINGIFKPELYLPTSESIIVDVHMIFTLNKDAFDLKTFEPIYSTTRDTNEGPIAEDPHIVISPFYNKVNEKGLFKFTNEDLNFVKKQLSELLKAVQLFKITYYINK